VAGLALCVLLGGALLVRSLSDDTYVAPLSTSDEPSTTTSAAPGRAAAALGAFEEALRRGDFAVAGNLAPEDDEEARDWLAATVRNAVALRLDRLSLRYVAESGPPDATGEWTAAVELTWRYRGFDERAARAEVELRLRDLGDRVGILGAGAGGPGSGGPGLEGGVTPLWLQGPLQVRRTPRTLVAVAGSVAEAARYDRLVRGAVPVVRAVLPQWRGGLVVEVPASAAGVDRAVGASPGRHEQIAAVTTSADGSSAGHAPVHVFVNPEVFGGLRDLGAQVVMAHEATHVATGAWTSDLPLWLLEGFADYVALRDVEEPLDELAAGIVAEVRADGVPARLPGDDDFGVRSDNLAATYESAWVACRLLARLGGEQALVALHDAVQDGEPLPSALREGFELTVPELTAAWQAELRTLAAEAR